MKKITLLCLVLFAVSFVNAQTSVTITSVNGLNEADWSASRNPVKSFKTNEAVDVVVTYAGITANTDIAIRLADTSNGWAPMVGMNTSTLAAVGTDGSITISWTPNQEAINNPAGQPKYHFQAWDAADGVGNYWYQVSVLNASTLTTDDFSTSKLQAFYNADRDAVIMKNRLLDGGYSIYNLMGQEVLEGEITNEISVETLKTGLYILSTEHGSLKFVK